jgi:uncharacterized protein YcbK (DUF882 family)
MSLDFIRKIVKIRKELGESMIVTSAYRCSNHPEEISKKEGKYRSHTLGEGIDIAWKSKRYRAKLIRIAHKCGIKGIGIGNTFVHLDNRNWDAMYFYKGFKG